MDQLLFQNFPPACADYPFDAKKAENRAIVFDFSKFYKKIKKGVDNREMVWYYSEAPYRKGAAAERGIRAREAAWDLEN
ncbi:MAG: hypothetical protein LKJ21_00010 [Oscillospiraceae bacterium]|jgi:hypothetical protein|nr:hypothetical protein [Oscillospiraceae bacterium]